MDKVPYLLRGKRPVSTQSSVLVSSSKYLNSAALREWLPTTLLRKNGPDFPPPADMFGFTNMLNSVRDFAEIEERITAERKINPKFDAWLSEWHISRYKLEDLAQYEPGSLGRTYYEWITEGNYEIELREFREPESQLDYIELRSGQTHDLEHIITGGQFNYVGELVPYWMRLSNVYQHLFDQELASEITQISIFGQLRYTVRTVLHYPYAWLACVDAIRRGIEVGTASEPIFMFKYEPVMHLPIDEVRKVLGVRGAVDVDTSLAGAIIAGTASPDEMRRLIEEERGLLPA